MPEFANARGAERTHTISYDGGARASERERVAEAPEQTAARRVEVLWHEADSMEQRAGKLSGIAVREEWRQERDTLRARYQLLLQALETRTPDAEASERARERYTDAVAKVDALGKELEEAKEPRPKPPVRDEIELEPLIRDRTLRPEQALAWVARLSAQDRQAVEDRLVAVGGTAAREDGFAVGLANYLADASVRRAYEEWARSAGLKAGPGQPTFRERFASVVKDPRHWKAWPGIEPASAASSPAVVSSSPRSNSSSTTPVQRSPARAPPGTTNVRSGDPVSVVSPEAGIEKPGFIDHSKGAPVYTAPAEAGGVLVRDVPLPPAARIFASGTHPALRHWWYVTAFLDGTMLRGYVEDFRVNVDLPEPLAELRQLRGGETVEALAREKFGHDVRDGCDLRFYENVLLYVNKGRAGIAGTYQDPGVLGGGANNIRLYKNHRIWLVSPAFARSLEGVLPSGSLTGGAVAKARRFARHLEDIIHSVTDSRRYLGQVGGEYAQAIRDHLPEVIGITAGFLLAESASMFLAAAPTGVSQAAAAVIQLALTAFGATGMVEGGSEALKHGSAWLTTAWTAHGATERIIEASKEFCRMILAVAIAALSYSGAKSNYRNALKIANNVPTGGLPALATAGAGTIAGADAATGVSIGPGAGAAGVAGNAAARVADKEEPGSLFDSYGKEASYKDEPPGALQEDAPVSEFDGYGLKTEEQLARERTDPRRPTWQESELKTNEDLDWTDFRGQRSFGGRREVRRGAAGSTRPDSYSDRYRMSIDVKNYGIGTPRAQSNLVKDIVQQMAQRAPHLPKGARQGLVIDVRGQRVASTTMEMLRSRIVRAAGGLVSPENIVFLTE